MLTGTDIFHAFQIWALTTSALLLMQDGQLLEKYRRFLEKGAFEWRHGWITKPLGLCGRCLCGQVGFWSALLLFGSTPGLNPLEVGAKTLMFTSFVILFNEARVLWLKI